MYTYHTYGGNIIRSDGAIIHQTLTNRDYRNYLAWVDEGNEATPLYTQADLDARAIKEEVSTLKTNLTMQSVWLFRMILEMWNVIKDKSSATNDDLSSDILSKAAIWKSYVDRLQEIDE